MLSKNAKMVRNSLITLALAAAVPTTWAADYTQVRAPVHKTAKAAPNRTLDLRAPDIRTVMTEDEIAAAIPVDETEVLGPEAVSVRGVVPAPYVPGGFAALYWAATNPTESWRIFTPVQ